MQIELFDARMLAPLKGFLDRSGICAGPLLDRARIPAELVAEGGWVAKKQAYDFTFDVVRRSDCPEAVYAAYLEFKLDHLGPIAAAMTACATVKESLEVALRLGGTAYEGNEYFLRADGDTTWMCYHEPRTVSSGQTYINDMTLAVYCQLVRALVDEDWRPKRVLIRQEINDRHRRIEQFADCGAACHADLTALAIPTEFLSRRLPSTLQAAYSKGSIDWHFGPADAKPVVERLHRLLASFVGHRKPATLEQVAGTLDSSPATLKRELAAAGTSYRQLLDRVRFDAACAMLEDSQVTVHQVAAELGYSGTNNFVRSFRRLTGTTPGEYRTRAH